jgi:glycosyltransferase involved in cell wall biosynthesis
VPAVSVIMPAYNVGPYLGAAARSVLVQTFADLELLIVDDGSTDTTAAVASECAAQDPRVRVFHQPNGGISSARNCALRRTRGRFFAILDSDDVWEPGYLEAQMRILEAKPEVAIVTGNAWFLGGVLDGRPARPCPDPRPHPDLAGMLEDETAVFIMSVFRRDVYETIGGFDESLRTNEDYDYWLRAASAGFRFHRNDQPLGRYRRREDSLSADEVRMLRGILRVLEKTRPALAGRPRELAILERKRAEFEGRCFVAEARLALEAGDVPTARARLAALPPGVGGPRIRLASLMARWTPGLLARLHQLRRGLQGVAP